MSNFSTSAKSIYSHPILSVAAGVAIIIGVMILRFFQIQVLNHDLLFKLREQQSLKREVILPKRGRIYDRDGFVLALTRPSISVYANPSRIDDLEKAAAELEELTGVPRADVIKRLMTARKFVWIRRQMDFDLKARVERSAISGIWYMTEDKRVYPGDETASHVIGFVNTDNQGLTGVELFYDGVLSGKPGSEKFYRDALGRKISSKILNHIPPVEGRDLNIALSRNIHQRVEEELKHYAFKYRLVEGTVVVMRATNREIVVMANYPLYDPNIFWKYPPAILDTNRAVHQAIEPKGLLMLLMTAAGIEKKTLSLHDTHFGQLSVEEYLLATSSVDSGVLGRVARYLGTSTVRDYFRSFGIGRQTGIDVQAESEGTLSEPVFLSGGQGVLMTPIQISNAVAALVSDGRMRRPKILVSGQSIIAPEEEAPRPILMGTTIVLRRILEKVVSVGQGKGALVEGYQVGGIGLKLSGNAKQKNSDAAFVGFVSENSWRERLVVFVMIRLAGTTDSEKALDTAKGLFRTVTYQAVKYWESGDGRIRTN